MWRSVFSSQVVLDRFAVDAGDTHVAQCPAHTWPGTVATVVNEITIELLRSIRLWQGERLNAAGLLSHPADAFRYAVLKAVGDIDHYARLRFN